MTTYLQVTQTQTQGSIRNSYADKNYENAPYLTKSFPDFGIVLTQCKNDTFESKNLATFAILKLKIVGR